MVLPPLYTMPSILRFLVIVLLLISVTASLQALPVRKEQRATKPALDATEN